MKVPQIALIGTEGSGKTVLATVLAKKFQKKQGGVWLDPIGAQTMKYLAHSWDELCDGRWLPSTPPGKLFELKWKMRVGDRECELKMIDSAGQDLRRLFSEEEYNAEDMSDQDRLFMDYIHHSTILLILINLGDFIGNANKDQVIENQAVLKGALDNLRKSNPNRQIAFVFPAYDLYEETIKNRYEGSIEKFLEDELPFLYNANVSDKNVKCFPVAAVAETEIKTDNEGRTMRVPAPNFSSTGLDQLSAWLSAVVTGGLAKQELEKKQKEEAEQQRIAAEQEAIRKQQREEHVKKISKWGSICFTVVVIICIGLFFVNAHRMRIEQAKQQVLTDAVAECARLGNEINSAQEALNNLQSEEIESVIPLAVRRADALEKAAMAYESYATALDQVKNPIQYLIDEKEKMITSQQARNNATEFRGIVASLRSDIETAKARSARPVPELGSNGIQWTKWCNEGLFDCWSHRVKIDVPINNTGTAGNITVECTLYDTTNRTTEFFNAGEGKWIEVIIDDLPRCPTEQPYVTYRAAGQ